MTARGTAADGLVQIYAGDAGGAGPTFSGRTIGGAAGLSDPAPAGGPGTGLSVRRDPARRLAVLSRDGAVVQVQTWSPAADPGR